MRPVTVVTICLCLVLSIEAQRPKPCESPPLLEGMVTVMESPTFKMTGSLFFYDGLLKRLRLLANATGDAQDTLLLFRERVQYRIFYQNQTCVQSALDTPFRPLEVPPDAQFLNQLVFGGSSQPGEGVLVNQWMGKVPETQGTYYSHFTKFGCLPFSEIYYTPTNSWYISYFNMGRGIRDPNVFIPPPFCEEKGSRPEVL
ncbi:ependymin [Amia ocellicauda]|uniref:ependymin n=1 Tax=Amia ocellicauda TaxID=2972642 RepID=UPI003463B087